MDGTRKEYLFQPHLIRPGQVFSQKEGEIADDRRSEYPPDEDEQNFLELPAVKEHEHDEREYDKHGIYQTGDKIFRGKRRQLRVYIFNIPAFNRLVILEYIFLVKEFVHETNRFRKPGIAKFMEHPEMAQVKKNRDAGTDDQYGQKKQQLLSVKIYRGVDKKEAVKRCDP
jgi:hypothetical protein